MLGFVVDPRRGARLPAAGFPVLAVLEVDFVVQVELEHRLIPALLGEVAGEAGGRGRELAPVFRSEGVFDPIAALEVLLVVHRPVLVERQVEGFRRHLAPGQVGEGRAVGERAEAGVPSGPVEGAIGAELRRGGDAAAPAVGEDVERQAMLMGKAEPRALLVHHPVAVHLGDERQTVGQGEVPDRDRERHVLTADAQGAAVFARLGVLGDLEFQQAAVRRGHQRVLVRADLQDVEATHRQVERDAMRGFRE